VSYKAHPTAVVEDAEIDEGTSIWHFAHIREGARIGRNCNVGKSAYVDTGVVIGDNVKIQNFVSIYHGVQIEDDVFIGPSATFTNDLYPRAFRWSDDLLVSTRVCRGASIGANATIICGITIGRYAMIGAGSVVTCDVPPHGLVIGNPARLSGFVCFCGRKLGHPVSEDERDQVYSCDECQETVHIHKPYIRPF